MLKTKHMIADAYLKLVRDNSLLNVNNDDIINTSGISRGTYYNNFESQQDILDYIQVQIEHELVAPIRDGLAELNAANLNMEQAISDIAKVSVPFLYAHSDRIMVLSECTLNHIWENPLIEVFKSFVAAKAKHNGISTKNVNIILNYIVIIIESWITEPNPEDPEKFIADFDQLYKQTITGLI